MVAGNRTSFQGWQKWVRSFLQLTDSLQHVWRVGNGGRDDPEAPKQLDPLPHSAQVVEALYNGLLATYRVDVRAYNKAKDEIGIATKRN